jgi:peptidoglycan/LPS O-acetylase OafA/YrhL
VVAQALALQIYLPGTDIDEFSQSWSISTEIAFYIALPFVVLLLGLARRRHPDLPVALLMASAVLSMLFVAFMPVGVVGEDVLVERWLPARWPNFAVGMLLAEVLMRPQTRFAAGVTRLARDTSGCLVLAGAALVLGTTPIAGPLTLGPVSGVQLAIRLALSSVVAGLLLAPLVLGHGDAYARALSSRPARAVGTVSYGLFLWHLPVFSAVYAVSGGQVFSGGILALLAIGLPVSLGLAWLSHVVVEVPAMKWAARRVPHRRTPLPR